MNFFSVFGISVQEKGSESKQIKKDKGFNSVTPFSVIWFGTHKDSKDEEPSD